MLDRWSVIQAGPNVKVTVYTAIKWKKSIWGLRNTIEKKAIEGSKESAELFFTMALPKIEQYNQERRLLLERQSQQGKLLSVCITHCIYTEITYLQLLLLWWLQR